MFKDFTLEAITKLYFGCKVTAFKTENTEKYYPAFPWRFSVRFNDKRHEYYGIPNYVESRARALKRGWYRAKWFSENTYDMKYSNVFK